MPATYVVQETNVYTDSRTGLRYRAEAGKLIDVTNAYYLGMPGAALPDDAWQPCYSGPAPTVASTYTVPTTAIYTDARTGIRHQAYAGAVIAMVNAYYLGMPGAALPDEYWQPCAPFAPTDVAGLTAWFDASALTGADGSAIASWPDASGNGYHAGQAVAGARPTLRTAGKNGRNVVRFDGVNDTLTTGVITYGGATGISIYCVLKPNTLAGTLIPFESGSGDGWYFLIDGTSGLMDFRWFGNVGYVNCQTDPGAITTAWMRASAVIDTTLASGEVSHWVNGVAIAQGGGNANNTLGAADRALFVGSRGGVAFFMPADYAEFLIYTGAHTIAQRTDVETYLRGKWGL